ncbi:MAG: ion channel, partial [Bacteroidota bacterium]
GLTYGSIYLLLIPFFAFIYQILPYHFYHSSIKYESSIDNDSERILQELRDWEVKNFKRHHGDFFIERDTLRLNGTTFSPKNIVVIKDSIEIQFQFEIMLEGFNNDIERSAFIRFPIETGIESHEVNGNDWAIKPYSFYGDISPFDPEFLFPNDYEYPEERLIIKYPLKLDKRLQAFAYATKGFPSNSSGSFGRMLYFSASTLTTLGLGDIIPISGIARLLVTIESLLGLILIGLFLNSLTFQMNKGKEKSP